MRVFVTKEFGRFARTQNIADAKPCEAVQRAEDGLIDADLGDGVIKQRVARAGQGRRSGFRTLIAYRRGKRAVFIHGFAKKDRGNIQRDEESQLKMLAAPALSLEEELVHVALETNKWREVVCDG